MTLVSVVCELRVLCHYWHYFTVNFRHRTLLQLNVGFLATLTGAVVCVCLNVCCKKNPK